MSTITRTTYTVEEVAEMIRERPNMIRTLCQRGRFKGAYRGGTGGRTSPWRIPQAAIDHYQQTQPRG